MLDTTLSIVCGEVHGKLGSAIDETKLMLTIMEDKFYCGGNRIVYTAVTKPVIYSDELIPDKIWKQLDFEIENRMHAYIDTIGSMLDLMEKQQIKKKLVMENCEKILQLITANGYMEESTLQDLTARMLQFEFFDEFRLMISDELRKKTQNMWEKEKKQYSPNITQVVEYINKNYATDISLEKCAEIVGCSYTSLSKEFKKETGMRFVEYLNIQRVNKAKSLLIRKDVSMKKIVELAGFRNYNYFFKVFKEIVGVTPSEFVAKK